MDAEVKVLHTASPSFNTTTNLFQLSPFPLFPALLSSPAQADSEACSLLAHSASSPPTPALPLQSAAPHPSRSREMVFRGLWLFSAPRASTGPAPRHLWPGLRRRLGAHLPWPPAHPPAGLLFSPGALSVAISQYLHLHPLPSATASVPSLVPIPSHSYQPNLSSGLC